MKQIRNDRVLELTIRELELRAALLSNEIDAGIRALKEDFMNLKKLGEIAKSGLSGEEDHHTMIDLMAMAGKLLL